MKKLLLIIMFLLTLGLTVSNTYAYKPYDSELLGAYQPYYYDFELIEDTPTYHVLVINEQTISTETNILYVNIPADSFRANTANGVDATISFYDSISDTWIDYFLGDLLLPGDTIQGDIRLTIRFNALAALGSILGDVLLYNFTKFKITLPLTQNSLPTEISEDLQYNYYFENTTIFTLKRYFLIQFVDRAEVVKADFVESDTIPTPPVLDPAPAGFVFIGWYAIDKNASGSDPVFIPVTTSGPNAYDNIVSGYFEEVPGADYRLIRLIARYKNLSTGSLTEPTFDATTPTGIENIFATFGMHNSTGYTIFFLFVILVLLIIFAGLKLPIIVYFIGTLATTLFFMFTGMLPVFISIIVILIMVVIFFSMNLGGNSYE
ncbi:MAG TPA: hypothetical protein PLV83_05470 [Bacilli bacterium]|nr:hypothetical protein [Bacilli bacterium]